jgi:hypothetical protein
MCFEQKVVRLVGFLGILFISIFYFLTAKSPVLVANEDYLVMKDGERYVSLSYIPRGFLREVWEEKLNSKITSISNTNLVELVCDESFCYSIKNKFTVLFEEVENIPYCTGGSLIKLIGVNSNLECEFQNTFNLDNLKYTPILIY